MVARINSRPCPGGCSLSFSSCSLSLPDGTLNPSLLCLILLRNTITAGAFSIHLCHSNIYIFGCTEYSLLWFFFFYYYWLINFDRRLITLQYCRFCHTSTWISHGCTCVPSSWTPLPLPSPPHSSGLSQSTSFQCPASCIELTLVI